MKRFFLLLIIPFSLLGEIITVNIKELDTVQVEKTITLDAAINYIHLHAGQDKTVEAFSTLKLGAKTVPYTPVALSVSLEPPHLILKPDSRYLLENNYYHVKMWLDIGKSGKWAEKNKKIFLPFYSLKYNLDEQMKFYNFYISEEKL